MTKISKNSEVSKAKTEKNVPVQKEAKKVVGIINEDGSVINFKSLEEAKEIGFKLRKQVKQLDYNELPRCKHTGYLSEKELIFSFMKTIRFQTFL